MIFWKPVPHSFETKADLEELPDCELAQSLSFGLGQVGLNLIPPDARTVGGTAMMTYLAVALPH